MSGKAHITVILLVIAIILAFVVYTRMMTLIATKFIGDFLRCPAKRRRVLQQGGNVFEYDSFFREVGNVSYEFLQIRHRLLRVSAF